MFLKCIHSKKVEIVYTFSASCSIKVVGLFLILYGQSGQLARWHSLFL